VKRFFFEKKNQKTFAPSDARQPSGAHLNWQKFLLLFSKRSASLLPAPAPRTAH
jgi:hypothetical protein